ncbi:MAG: hypothetical protein ACOYKZ_04540 [Chlamydiia bacterium]
MSSSKAVLAAQPVQPPVSDRVWVCFNWQGRTVTAISPMTIESVELVFRNSRLKITVGPLQTGDLLFNCRSEQGRQCRYLDMHVEQIADLTIRALKDNRLPGRETYGSGRPSFLDEPETPVRLQRPAIIESGHVYRITCRSNEDLEVMATLEQVDSVAAIVERLTQPAV